MLQRAPVLALALGLTALSCQSTTDADSRVADAIALGATTVDADPAVREPMLQAVRALEGRWVSEEMGEHVFTVSSMGTVVRELMAPGQPHEMTNMYHLDGNTMVMTHYCGAGNQPRMRATSFEDGTLAFASDSVTDLKSADDHYMGAMVLRFVSEDVVEQHWQSINGGVASEMGVFTLRRAE